MKTAEDIARYIRHRQHELAALKPELRRSMLIAEIGQLCADRSAAERKALLGEAEELFPTGYTGPGIDHSPLPASAPPTAIEFEDVMHGLERELETLPESDRAALREQIANRLGLRNVGSSTAVPSALKVEHLLSALEALKRVALCDPDPILNPNAGEAFSRHDIRELAAWGRKLTERADDLSKYLWEQLSQQTQQQLTRFLTNRKGENECAEALAGDLCPIFCDSSLYDAERFKNVKLSDETAQLLRENPTGRRLERLNQALLEDAYPELIRRYSTERKVIEELQGKLSPHADQPFATGLIVAMAAGCLLELGCLERYGHRILESLDDKIFDPVFSKLNEKADLGKQLLGFVQNGDVGAMAKGVRDSTGLIKSLLYWYLYGSGLGATALSRLVPEGLSGQAGANGVFTRGNNYQRVWESFTQQYQQTYAEVCGVPYEANGRAPDLQVLAQEVKKEIRRNIARKVTTHVSDNFPDGFAMQ